ncbi:outer membrane lipoprotein LolB [Alteromonas sp. 345S023]|uniref:Outer-membrane lipoprotein LolB n=1 Tax=Alteromonas profundi TaxID=2696062 RepID=A0A7X5LKG9_9ALTE|nr:lipoprotein insertase outer membrane protein LolB [Alteromonas profundi]NDV91042.1 outer membrane lipoprotein LolB [Alteromonas profundi]
MIRNFIMALLCTLFIGACTVTPDGPKQAVNLSAQLKQVAQVDTWELRGKMAFRRGDEAASANLRWKTDGDDFHFRLTNMLGVTMVSMVVDDNGAVLEADGETYKDAVPAPLIYYATGMDVPVAPLLSWIKGMPLATDTYTLNDKGLLATLRSGCSGCQGWDVSYSNYGSVTFSDSVNDSAQKQVWLPHLITLTQEPIQPPPTYSETAPSLTTTLKIRIYQWTIP